MICREQEETFVLVKQHHHGLVSGRLAAVFLTGEVPNPARRAEVLHAIGHHDRAWIDLDETPFWNDAAGTPYSFIDFPVVPKLTFYTRGLDEIEAETAYGALLVSLHFERLIEVAGERGPELSLFQEHEKERRARIRRELEHTAPIGEAELYNDSRLLQFCDDLSLYLALHEPGTPKSETHPWWQDGFSGSEDFPFTEGRRIEAEWQGSTLTLDPYPFTERVELMIPLRRVSKADIAAKGLARAYAETPVEDCRIAVDAAQQAQNAAEGGHKEE